MIRILPIGLLYLIDFVAGFIGDSQVYQIGPTSSYSEPPSQSYIRTPYQFKTKGYGHSNPCYPLQPQPQQPCQQPIIPFPSQPAAPCQLPMTPPCQPCSPPINPLCPQQPCSSPINPLCPQQPFPQPLSPPISSPCISPCTQKPNCFPTTIGNNYPSIPIQNPCLPAPFSSQTYSSLPQQQQSQYATSFIQNPFQTGSGIYKFPSAQPEGYSIPQIAPQPSLPQGSYNIPIPAKERYATIFKESVAKHDEKIADPFESVSSTTLNTTSQSANISSDQKSFVKIASNPSSGSSAIDSILSVAQSQSSQPFLQAPLSSYQVQPPNQIGGYSTGYSNSIPFANAYTPQSFPSLSQPFTQQYGCQPFMPQPFVPQPSTPNYQQLNNCCFRCQPNCKTKKALASKTSLGEIFNRSNYTKVEPLQRDNCTNVELKKIIEKHSSNKISKAKELIRKESVELFGTQNFHVFCSAMAVEYLTRTDFFCVGEFSDGSCYIFKTL